MIQLPNTLSLSHRQSLDLGSVTPASQAFVTAELASRIEQPLLLITPDTASAYRLEQELHFFAAG
ncbi:MAG: hypothetical protein VYE54_13765, partial [Pseudomonadota bacterium]|nr:hypothetical protein [Pseudomonadota bacterium]